jgi:putative hydrolase of the HAD superfamily
MKAVAEVLERDGCGGAPEIFDQLMLLHAESPQRVFDRWLARSGAACDARELVEAFRDHEPRIEMIPGARELVASLRERGVATGIVTDGYEMVQRRKVAALACSDLFDAVVPTDAPPVSSWKPSPIGLLHAAEQMRREPAGVIYIGDNAGKDLEAARAAGMKFVWARYARGYHSGIEPGDDEAMIAIFDEFTHLAAWLQPAVPAQRQEIA